MRSSIAVALSFSACLVLSGCDSYPDVSEPGSTTPTPHSSQPGTDAPASPDPISPDVDAGMQADEFERRRELERRLTEPVEEPPLTSDVPNPPETVE